MLGCNADAACQDSGAGSFVIDNTRGAMTMDGNRRLVVGAAAALAAGVLAARSAGSETITEELRYPEIPVERTPGKPGDFAFLTGEWRIANRRKPPGATEWDEFEGEATVVAILNGIGSVEELRIPARKFAGMGLRLLDLASARWIDHWVNAKSGVLTLPGLPGSFENGAGIFSVTDKDDVGEMLILSLWDSITSSSCRWRQAVSRDQGRSWDTNWIMHWTRVRGP
jgi:hypothetical protein